jgi:hypothetical protein
MTTATGTGATGQKKIIIVAGPNGAGKTTFARSFLPAEADLPRFINADLIAAGLAPFAPDTAAVKAARLMLEEIALCARNGEMAGTGLSGQPVLPEPAQCRNRDRTGGVSCAAGRPRHSRSGHPSPLCSRSGKFSQALQNGGR